MSISLLNNQSEREDERVMTVKPANNLRIMAVDCCEHAVAALNAVPSSHLLSVASKDSPDFREGSDIDLIAIGIARYPVRRLFISQLRRIYPNVPILILRRERISATESTEWIRCEFILGDQVNDNDCEIVRAIRGIMPIQPCAHLQKDEDFDTVRDVIGALAEKYSDPTLDLAAVAMKMRMSPKRLSVILNKNVGVSFRQLLRNIRIEEAKRILRLRRYSVKEVASRVGFADSHYFSRSFKEVTGVNAGEYLERSSFLG